MLHVPCSRSVALLDGSRLPWLARVVFASLLVFVPGPWVGPGDVFASGHPGMGDGLQKLEPATSMDRGPGPGATAAPGPGDERWTPWLGCWMPEAEDERVRSSDGSPVASGLQGQQDASGLLCFEPREGAGVLVREFFPGRTPSEELLVSDGEARDVERGGCEGAERSEWSSDGALLFLRSDLKCAGGTPRSETSILAFDGPERWTAVTGVAVGKGEVAIGLTEYRVAHDAPSSDPEARPHRPHRSLAAETARQAASVPLTADHVREATERVHPEVVTALILQREARIPLDAETLIALDEAGVPSQVIDLLVAMDNPDHFHVEQASSGASMIRAEQGAERSAGPRQTLRPDPFLHGPRGFHLQGRGFHHSSFRSSYGAGGRFGRIHDRAGPVVVVPKDRARDDSRVVRGEGYRRGDGPPTVREAERESRRAIRERRRPGASADDSSGTSRITPRGATRSRGDSDDDRSTDRDRRARDRSGGGGDGS